MKRQKKYLLGIGSLFLIALISLCVYMHIPRTKVSNFMINESGKFLRIDTIYNERIGMGEYFHLYFYDRPVALSLVDFESGKEIIRSTFVDGCEFYYPLDTERIVCNCEGVTGIWNIKKNSFLSTSGHCLGFPGINYKENMVISCSMFDGEEAYIYDVDKDRTKYIFPEYKITSPRFSPDDSQFAFFGEIGGDREEKHNYLIVQKINEDKIYKIELIKGKQKRDILKGHILSWSQTGKFLAGIVWDYQYSEKLIIWKENEDLISIIPLGSPYPPPNFINDFYWAPVWLPNDIGVAIFYWDNKNFKISYKIINVKSDLNN